MRGGVTLVQSEELPQDALRDGEATRWLAETALIPTALLPRWAGSGGGMVHWKPSPHDPDNQAILELLAPVDDNTNNNTNNNITSTAHHHNKTLQLVATFDSDHGWLTRMEGMRPMIKDKDNVQILRWVGIYANYRWIQGMWIPTHMESGWIHNNDNNNTNKDTKNVTTTNSSITAPSEGGAGNNDVDDNNNDASTGSGSSSDGDEEEVTFYVRLENVQLDYVFDDHDE